MEMTLEENEPEDEGDFVKMCSCLNRFGRDKKEKGLQICSMLLWASREADKVGQGKSVYISYAF